VSGRRRVSTALLVSGYVLAAGAGAKLWPAWRERRTGRFLAFETGTVMVATGLLLRGRTLPAIANGATATVLGLAWVARDRCAA
jgi:mannose-1-phosphate guanylyltransferase